MAWAARATVISRVVGTAMVLKYFLGKNNIIKTKISDFKIRFSRFKEIFLVWVPSLARQVASSGVVIVINNILWVYGWTLAIAAYGIVNRAMQVFFMPMFGIVQWMQPILWYNHGAGFKHRVKEVTLLSVKVLTIFCVVIFAICMIFPWLLLNLFSTDQALLQMATPAMRIILMMFPFIWFQIIASWFYQALWKVRPAFLFAIMRQALFLLPILLILPKFWGLNWVWYAFPASDFLAAVVIFFVFRYSLKKIV
jgi:Na+-driven multidrug efflux pump